MFDSLYQQIAILFINAYISLYNKILSLTSITVFDLVLNYKSATGKISMPSCFPCIYESKDLDLLYFSMLLNIIVFNIKCITYCYIVCFCSLLEYAIKVQFRSKIQFCNL